MVASSVCEGRLKLPQSIHDINDNNHSGKNEQRQEGKVDAWLDGLGKLRHSDSRQVTGK